MEPKEIVAKLHYRHLSDLKHIKSMSLFGWENYDEYAFELVSFNLIKGSWMGSLEHPARPMWTITELGRKVLAHWEASLNEKG